MNKLYGIICLTIGLYVLIDSILNKKKILRSLREMESDLGISYYKGIIGGLIFIVLGILLLLDHS